MPGLFATRGLGRSSSQSTFAVESFIDTNRRIELLAGLNAIPGTSISLTSPESIALVQGLASSPLTDDEIVNEYMATISFADLEQAAAQLSAQDKAKQIALHAQMHESQQAALANVGYVPPTLEETGGGILSGLGGGPVGSLIETIADAPFDAVEAVGGPDLRPPGLDALVLGAKGIAAPMFAAQKGVGLVFDAFEWTDEKVITRIYRTAERFDDLMKRKYGNEFFKYHRWFTDFGTMVDAWGQVGDGERAFLLDAQDEARQILAGVESDRDVYGWASAIAAGDSVEDILSRSGLDSQDPAWGEMATELYAIQGEERFANAVDVLANNKMSIGRGLVRHLGGDPSQGWGQWVSGSFDAAQIIVLDPFLFVGKFHQATKLNRFLSSADMGFDGERAALLVEASTRAQRGEDVTRLLNDVEALYQPGRLAAEPGFQAAWFSPRDKMAAFLSDVYRGRFSKTLQHKELLREGRSYRALGERMSRAASEDFGFVALFNDMPFLRSSADNLRFGDAEFLGWRKWHDDAVRAAAASGDDLSKVGLHDPAGIYRWLSTDGGLKALGARDLGRQVRGSVTMPHLTRVKQGTIMVRSKAFRPLFDVGAMDGTPAYMEGIMKVWREAADLPKDHWLDADAFGNVFHGINGGPTRRRNILSGPRRLAQSFFHHIPIEGSRIPVEGPNALAEFDKFVNVGGLGDMSLATRNMWRTMFLDGDTNQRRAVVHALTADIFHRTGIINSVDDSGAKLVERFIARSSQEYGVGSRHALFEGQLSDSVAIPNFKEVAVAAARTNAARHTLGRVHGAVDARINRVWKPLVLMRIGFIPRAFGEEALSFVLRHGPLQYLQAKYGVQWVQHKRRTRDTPVLRKWEDIPNGAVEPLVAKPFLAYHALMRRRHHVTTGQLDLAAERALDSEVLRKINNLTADDLDVPEIRQLINEITAGTATPADYAARIADPDTSYGITRLRDELHEALVAKEVAALEAAQKPRVRRLIERDKFLNDIFLRMGGSMHAMAQRVGLPTRETWGAALLGLDPDVLRMPLAARRNLRDPLIAQQAKMYRAISMALDDPTIERGYARAAGSKAYPYLAEGKNNYGSLIRVSDPRADTGYREIDMKPLRSVFEEITHNGSPEMDFLDAYHGWLNFVYDDPSGRAGVDLLDRYVGGDTLDEFGRLFGELYDGSNTQVARNVVDAFRNLEDAGAPMQHFHRYVRLGNEHDLRRFIEEIAELPEAGEVLRILDKMPVGDHWRIKAVIDSGHRGDQLITGSWQFFEDQVILRAIRGRLFEPDQRAISRQMVRGTRVGDRPVVYPPARGTVRAYAPMFTDTDASLVQRVLDSDNERQMFAGHLQAVLANELSPNSAERVFAEIMENLHPAAHLEGGTLSQQAVATTQRVVAQRVRQSVSPIAFADPETGDLFTRAMNSYLEARGGGTAGLGFVDMSSADEFTGSIASLSAAHQVRLTPIDAANQVDYVRLEDGRWVEKAQAPQGEKVTASFRGWGVSEADALETLARDQLAEIRRLLTTQRGGRREVLSEITHGLRQGFLDSHTLRRPAGDDLPKSIYGPAKVARLDHPWAKVVRGWFDSVVTPAGEAIIRTPHFHYNMAAVIDEFQHIPRQLRTQAGQAYDDGLAVLNRFGDEFSAGVTEFGQFQWARLDDLDDSDAAWRQLGKALDSGDVGEANKTLSRIAGQQVNLTSDELDNVVVYLKTERAAHRLVRDAAIDGALARTLPMIDDHRIRSQFQEHMGTLLPFWFAEEQFLRRIGRAVKEDPAVVRRLYLMIHAGRASGAIQRDQYGEEVFVFPPGTAPVFNALANVAPRVFGHDLMGLEVDELTMNVNYIIPGYTEDFGHFQWGPQVAAPLSWMSSRMPEWRPVADALFPGDDRSLGRSPWEYFVPTTITNLMRAVRANPDNVQVASAMNQAIAILEANGQGLDETDDPHEIETYLDRLRHTTRGLLLARTAVGFIGFSTPQTGYDEQVLVSEFYSDLIDQGVPFDEAVRLWRERHPDAELAEFLNRDPADVPADAALLVGRTTAEQSGAPIDASEIALNWMEGHEDLISSFPSAAPWLMPRDPDPGNPYSRMAREQQLAHHLRVRRSPKEFLEAAWFAESAETYFDQKEADELELAGARSVQERRDIEERQRLWHQAFLNTRPSFADQLQSADGKNRRERIVVEMRQMLALPEPPDSPVWETIEPLAQILVDYDDQIRWMRHAQGSMATEMRRQLRIEAYDAAQTYVLLNPDAAPFWHSVLRPLLGGFSTELEVADVA